MADRRRPIDEIIEEAHQEGKFDDLEGKGKPLDLDPSPDAVIKNLLKHANVKPEWIELSAELDRRVQELERLLDDYSAWEAPARVAAEARERATPSPSRAWWRGAASLLVGGRASARPASAVDDAVAEFNRRWDATLSQYATLLHTMNRKVRRFNAIVPVGNRQQRPIDVAGRLETFAERFPRLARGAEGGVAPVRGHVPDALLAPPREACEERGGRDLDHAAALQTKRSFGHRPPPIG